VGGFQMEITGTQFAYYLICKRKLWLFSKSITLEQDSELVAMGRLIHETTYSKRSDRFKELSIRGIKIDFFDRKTKSIHEIKKSDSYEEAQVLQVKFYIHVLELNGITGVSGIIEYPKLHRTEKVEFTNTDRLSIEEMIGLIRSVIESKAAPVRLKVGRCKNCSYFDFCWTEEES
jgi:CRISPR-associated exonuclease Cas4